MLHHLIGLPNNPCFCVPMNGFPNKPCLSCTNKDVRWRSSTVPNTAGNWPMNESMPCSHTKIELDRCIASLISTKCTRTHPHTLVCSKSQYKLHTYTHALARNLTVMHAVLATHKQAHMPTLQGSKGINPMAVVSLQGKALPPGPSLYPPPPNCQGYLQMQSVYSRWVHVCKCLSVCVLCVYLPAERTTSYCAWTSAWLQLELHLNWTRNYCSVHPLHAVK